MKKPPSKLRPGPGPTPPPCNRGWPEEKGQARGIGLPARKWDPGSRAGFLMPTISQGPAKTSRSLPLS